jgi:hypothetical protein
MMYVDFNVKEDNYKLRLATRNIVALEKAIGCNPLGIFGKGEDIPSVTTMVNILWFSLQKYHHGIQLTDAYNIFDDYLEEHSMTDFIAVILDVYKVSGIIKDDRGAEDEKNAVAEE